MTVKFAIGYFSAILLLVVEAELHFVKVPGPRQQYVVDGQQVLFECKVGGENEEYLDYSWTRNGVDLDVNDFAWGAYSRSGRSDLVVSRFVASRDAGEYVCVVTNLLTGARLSSPAASLNLLKYKSADVRILEQLRHSVTLFCDAKTNADQPMLSNVTWFRNHREVQDDDIFMTNNFKLRVKTAKLDREPAGVLRCGAHSAAGVVFSGNFDLGALVANIDKIMQRKLRDRHKKRSSSNDSPRQMHYLADEQIELSCSVTPTGTDQQLVWTKDGQLLVNDGRMHVDATNGSLLINHGSGADAGIYNCESRHVETNETLQRGVFYAVYVQYKLKFTPTPTSRKLELGVPGKVHCKAQGGPGTETKWYSGITDDLLNDPTLEEFNGTLHFKNVSKTNAGNYTCVASNPSQGKIAATINVQVVMSPRFVVAPVGPLLVRENESIWLHCQAIGDPAPTIQWDKNLEYLTLNVSDEEARVRLLENGTLYITEVLAQDEGKYGCTIGNSGGLKREEIFVAVKAAGGTDGDGNDDDDFTVTKALLVTMALATTYILFVVVLMMWCRYKKRGRDQPLGSGDGTDENKMNEIDPFVTNSTSREAGTLAQANGKRAGQFNADSFTIDRAEILNMVQIGRGEFGDVFVGNMTVRNIKAIRNNAERETMTRSKEDEEVPPPLTNGSATGNGTGPKHDNHIEVVLVDDDPKQDDKKQVLVKALSKLGKDELMKAAFYKQMEMFGSAQHRNVTRLYAVCVEKMPHYMVLEYTDWGDLKQFLIATSSQAKEKKIPPLNWSQTLTLAQQISRGMDALNKNGFLHKDLAARNCVISSLFVAKVSLPALTKDKYASEYAKFRDQTLPVRWLAPEAIRWKLEGEDSGPQYSAKSEVWSYGVCVWELFNQATMMPHQSLSNEDYINKVLAGEELHLELPPECPDTVRELVTKCWSTEPAERPSFSQLTATIIARIKSELSTSTAAVEE